MAIRKKTSTTNLPQSLLHQIAESSTSESLSSKDYRISQSDSANEHTQDRRHQHLASRKEARRQGRAAQKQRRAEYFSHASNTRKRPAEDHSESPQRKKHRESNPESAPEVKRYVIAQQRMDMNAPHIPIDKTTSKSSEKPSKNSSLKKLSKSSAPKTSPPREDPEDAYITYLEAQLGLRKGGKKKAKEEEDGLDGMSWKIL